MKNKQIEYCIVSCLFDVEGGYREAVLYRALAVTNVPVRVITAHDPGSRGPRTERLNITMCRTLIKYANSYVAFARRPAREVYKVLITSDARQLFTVWMALFLSSKETKVVYEHEQRSEGLSWKGKLFSRLLVNPLIRIIANRADIIRVANELSGAYLRKVSPANSHKVIEVPLAVDTNIFNTNNKRRSWSSLRVAWSGKNAYGKNFSLITSAILALPPLIREAIQLTVVTNENVDLGPLANQSTIMPLQPNDRLAEVFRSCDVTIWTTPTQSYFESAACGNYVICPSSGITRDIETYTDSFLPINVKCNEQGLALKTQENIQRYTSAIEKIYWIILANKSVREYKLDGSKYLSIIQNTI